MILVKTGWNCFSLYARSRAKHDPIMSRLLHVQALYINRLPIPDQCLDLPPPTTSHIATRGGALRQLLVAAATRPQLHPECEAHKTCDYGDQVQRVEHCREWQEYEHGSHTEARD